MHEDYGSRSMCVSVCACVYVPVSVTTLIAIYLVYMLKSRWH